MARRMSVEKSRIGDNLGTWGTDNREILKFLKWLQLNMHVARTQKYFLK
mgnify:CR=1 FL=1